MPSPRTRRGRLSRAASSDAPTVVLGRSSVAHRGLHCGRHSVGIRMKRVLVTGGRDFRDRQAVYGALDAEHRAQPITLVIHGACKNRNGHICGADGLAQEWAISREVPYLGVPAKWALHKLAGGPIRNGDMLRDWKPHRVFAFPGGRGTADMVEQARLAKVPTTEVRG